MDWRNSDLRGVQIYEEEWSEGWVSMVEHGPKYKEKDWTKRDLRGVQIYEEEWSVGGVRMVQNIRKRIGRREIYGESRYMKRNGLEE